MLTIFLFLLGFIILIKGAGFLVKGASSIAKFLNIPNFVIGLVIAGIGTSIPEFSIAFVSHLAGTGDIGLGTIIGSNSFNILFILGVTVLAFALPFRREWVMRDLKWNIYSVAAAAVFAFGLGGGSISRFEGAAMLALFFWWLFIVVKKTNHAPEDEVQTRTATFPLALVLIFVGFAGVFLGGKWVVDGAVEIARLMGAGEPLIGLTIVGIGTSLPELAVTFTAARRNLPGIAVGNIIGSNIFDFLMILGVAALVRPVSVPPSFTVDMAVTLFAAVILFGFMFFGKSFTLKRRHGIVFLSLYALYFIFLLWRG